MQIYITSTIVKQYSTICSTIKSLLNIEVMKEDVLYFQNSLQYYIGIVAGFRFAFKMAFMLSSAIGILFVLTSLMLLLHQFKQDVLKYRTGNQIYKVYHLRATLVHSGFFPAMVITTNAIGFILIIGLLTLCLIPICMKEFYQYLYQYRTIIFVMLGTLVAELILSRITKAFGFKKENIKNRM